jgi:hypothetical protein
MDTLTAVYFVAFLVGSGLSVFSWAFGHHGHAHHGGGHHGGHGHHGAGGAIRWWSPFANISALSVLLCVGGGVGLVSRRAGLSSLPAAGAALGSGMTAALAVNALIGWIARGTRYAVPRGAASVGTVIARIGPGVGEVAYTHQGARAALPARSADGRPIATGVEVAILDVENGVAKVVPTDELLKTEKES